MCQYFIIMVMSSPVYKRTVIQPLATMENFFFKVVFSQVIQYFTIALITKSAKISASY